LRREGSPPWRWSSGPSEAATTRSRRQVGPRRRRSITTR
jgi:hypothetical protein